MIRTRNEGISLDAFILDFMLGEYVHVIGTSFMRSPDLPARIRVSDSMLYLLDVRLRRRESALGENALNPHCESVQISLGRPETNLTRNVEIALDRRRTVGITFFARSRVPTTRSASPITMGSMI